jgi:hypothetical protein
VIAPLVTVICTCTGPNLVSMASPVTVLVVDALDGVVDGAVALDGALAVAPVGAVVVPAEVEPALGVLGVVLGTTGAAAIGTLAVLLCVLKLSSMTRPVTVLKRARATRRMGMSLVVAKTAGGEES